MEPSQTSPRWVEAEDLHNGFTDITESILDVALQLADNKKTITQIKKEHMKNQKPKTRSKGFPPKGYTAIRKLQKSLASITAMNPKAVQGIYDRYQKDLTEALRKKMKSSPWKNIETPLPKVLLNKDLFLAALRRPDAIVERLQEMKDVIEAKKNRGIGSPSFAPTIEVIDIVLANMEQFGATRRLPCFDAIKHFGNQAAPKKPAKKKAKRVAKKKTAKK